jgi:hypothetical protein
MQVLIERFGDRVKRVARIELRLLGEAWDPVQWVRGDALGEAIPRVLVRLSFDATRVDTLT